MNSEDRVKTKNKTKSKSKAKERDIFAVMDRETPLHPGENANYFFKMSGNNSTQSADIFRTQMRV